VILDQGRAPWFKPFEPSKFRFHPYNTRMIQKHIPSRRIRPDRSPAARPAGSSLYKPKRVRAGGTAPKPRKKRVPGQGPTPPPAPLVAPELNEKQRRHLRGLAHDLKPLIRLGNAGLTDSVAAETARALHDHELVKVKAPGGDRGARDTLFTGLAQKTFSALVHRIGNVAVLYRPNRTLQRIMIPDANS
jgi:RNA-binding protein